MNNTLNPTFILIHINWLRFVEKFKQMEIEKKKSRPSKRTYHGPTIRYHSMSMPRVEELDQPEPIQLVSTSAKSSANAQSVDALNESGVMKMEEDDAVDNDAASTATNTNKIDANSKSAAATGPRCERTFITFDNDLDERAFLSYFPSTTAAAAQRQRQQRQRINTVCPITRLPARYFDPMTQLPYRNVQAFKILREAYYQQLEGQCNVDKPDVRRWLAWRRRLKEQRVSNKMLKSAANALVAGV